MQTSHGLGLQIPSVRVPAIRGIAVTGWCNDLQGAASQPLRDYIDPLDQYPKIPTPIERECVMNPLTPLSTYVSYRRSDQPGSRYFIALLQPEPSSGHRWVMSLTTRVSGVSTVPARLADHAKASLSVAGSRFVSHVPRGFVSRSVSRRASWPAISRSPVCTSAYETDWSARHRWPRNRTRSDR